MHRTTHEAQQSAPEASDLFARALEPSSQLQAALAAELHALHGSLARQTAQLRSLEDSSDADILRGGARFLAAQSASVRQIIRNSRQVQGTKHPTSSKQRKKASHRRAFKSHG